MGVVDVIIPPMPYYGSKVQMAPIFASLLPPHRHYVEPFAGSLAVLLAKQPSDLETVNDLDGQLTTFWKCLRDMPEELEAVCELTPHSREQFLLDHYPVGQSCPVPHPEPCTDPDCARWRDLESSRRLWSRISQGRMGRVENSGWRFDVNPNNAEPKWQVMRRYIQRFAPVADRIRHVQIENMDALELIQRYGVERDVCIYADPPYLVSTRASTGYRFEMAREEQHVIFLETVLQCRAAVVVSGYRHPLYDQMLSGWHVEEFPTTTNNGGSRKAQCEVLWSNVPLGGRRQLSILDLIKEHVQ